jgi:cytidylate kinase
MAIITISRQTGAGGSALGKMIADELGYAFADWAIVDRVAKEANVSPHWVETMEKEAGGKFTRFIAKMVSRPLAERILKDEHAYIDEQLYLDYIVLIISQIAEEGNVVIIGRGSQYILNDHPDAYHILLINDLESRVQFTLKQYSLPQAKAFQVVQREDKRRMNLYRKLGKTDYYNSRLYHLVLNMGKINLQHALKMVCDLVKP